ncbi:uncharacterized protein I303_104713 [Kwoniella dejecticola CBS 10117]|uniref:DNA repair protein rhp7 treble clef domain-containing protein n=1 Tax=Kwoniella dejecticola CBS 10117 TaxID=1296121 RepID=A0AAJ8MIC4_9TREE
MSRNRRAAGAVRGPASALTSFLAGLGVEPSTRLTTWGNTSDLNADGAGDQPSLAHDGPVIDAQDGLDPAGAVTAHNVIAGPTDAGDGTAQLEDETRKRKRDDDTDEEAVNKRNRAASINSDDLDADNIPEAGPSKTVSNTKSATPAANVAPGPLKAVGEFMECGQCAKRFTVTAYTKEHPSQPSTFLCVNCCYALGIDPFAKVKKPPMRKKMPVQKEDRAKVVHYEQKKGVLALGDLCIQIISKSRRLTPETAQLFYSADRDSLSMYDCTRLTPDAFIAMSKLCPKLTTLHLHLCGQLSADAMTAWGKSLKQLKRVELFAPFLVRKEGWVNLLKAIGKRLESFLITQSPRIDLETIKILVKSCPNLVELRLAEVGQLNDDCLAVLQSLKKLRYLDLSAAGTPLTDEAVIALVSAIGDGLEELVLADNSELTDAILPVIAEHCPRLRRLSLRNLVELSSDGVAEFFSMLKAKNRSGYEHIDLEKGHDLQDAALDALLAHSGNTVEKLNLLGWREVSNESLSKIAHCKHLKELDIGWCRQVTDFTVKDVLEGCNEIQTVRVWGCNQLTDNIPRKKGVQVIGVESHSI